MSHPEHPSDSETSVNIQQQLVEVLDTMPSADKELRQTQLAIISKLPENFVQELHAHLMASDIERQHFNEEPTKTREEQLRVLRGELFERVIAIQVIAAQEQEEASVELQRGLANEALALFHNAERFNIKGGGRNPDLAVVNIETKEIVAVMEAKNGLFDERAYKQAQGFKSNLVRTLDEVRAVRAQMTAEEFQQKHGLSEDITNLHVAENLQRIFFVPADRDTSTPERLIKFRNHDGSYAFRNVSDRRNFIDQIDRGDIRVYKSAFSTKEIAALADKLMDEIEKRY